MRATLVARRQLGECGDTWSGKDAGDLVDLIDNSLFDMCFILVENDCAPLQGSQRARSRSYTKYDRILACFSTAPAPA